MLKLLSELNDELDPRGTLAQLDGVAVLDCRVADPRALHDGTFLAGIEEALGRIEADPGCRLVVCQGLGVAGRASGDELPEARLYGKREQVLKRLRELAAPSVALIDGACAGVHFEIALGADACLATAESSFAIPEVAEGRLPGMATFRLATQIGLRGAARLMLLNETLSAAQAQAAGLVGLVCPAGEFPRHVAAMLERVTAEGGLAVRMSRRLLEEAFTTSYEDSVGHYLAAQHRCYAQRQRDAGDRR